MTPIAAIPTRYAGVQFRSRLEARWAAFFDLLDWPWEYEPIDLNGYIPDFSLKFYRPMLVEVKPILRWPCLVTHCQDQDCFHDAAVTSELIKIWDSDWKHEIVLVGASLREEFNQEYQLGALAQEDDFGPPGEASFISSWADLFLCTSCNVISFCSNTHSYHCRVNGCHDGYNHKGEPGRLDLLWREAGNRVQWKRPR